MKRIQVILVEDNRLLREGLAALIQGQSDMKLLAAVGNGDSLKRANLGKAHVILLDIILGSHSSLKLVKSIISETPGPRIVVMDLAPVQPSLVEYVSAGVSGFVLKDATFEEFLSTIRSVANGSKVLPPMLTSSLFTAIAENATKSASGNPFASVKMTRREREVIELIAEGMSNKQIASRLNLAVDTIKSHVHNILEKLALHTRLEIASYHHSSGPGSKSSGTDGTHD
jgi:DNA-binding NarL/FixJ family response regulator